MTYKKNSWLRASALAVLGLGIAYGAQSFTNKEEVKTQTPVSTSLDDPIWYNNELVDSDPTNPANYALTSKFDCGEKTEEICSIKAPNNGSGQPDMSHTVSPGVTVEDQIEDAVSTSSTNATVQAFRSNQ
ncbi:MAG: hypothetical protein LBJ04_04880 [Sphingobacterium sp.]|jgi:hypothetical protein|nr:hypothetical protein [Sphingobacterium sp.]